VAKEFELIKKVLEELRKESGLVTYGKVEVKQAAEYKAIEELFVLDELVRKDKEVEAIIEEAEKRKVKMTIFSAANQAGKELASLGGLAALLRFKIA